MDEVESLSHMKWECKYHVLFIPKCRGKMESQIKEGHLLSKFLALICTVR